MISADGSQPPRIRLFKSDRLEKLTTITPRGFALTWSAIIVLAIGLSWRTAGAVAAVGFVLLGALVWTLFEYAMHRFVFHLKAHSGIGQQIIFVMHGNHHDTPNDIDRNLMPTVVSIPILGTFWGLSLLLFGAAGSIVFIGFALGYVFYDSVHYACHQFPMRAPILRQLRRHHIRHHFAKEHGNYAITAIFWDRVFRTRLLVKGR